MHRTPRRLPQQAARAGPSARAAGLAQGGVGFRSTGELLRQQGQESAKRGLDVPDHGEFGGVSASEVADIGGRPVLAACADQADEDILAPQQARHRLARVHTEDRTAGLRARRPLAAVETGQSGKL